MTARHDTAYRRVAAPGQRPSGFSLVELMIALAIGMILLMGVSMLILQQSKTRTELAKSNRQIENGRYAMQLLHDDIQHAGFYGQYSPPFGATFVVDGSATLGTCADSATAPTNLGWIASTTPTFPVAIFGYAGAAANPACGTPSLLINRKPGTGILVIRRVATETVAVAAAVANTTYLQVSSCDSDPITTPFVLGSAGFSLREKNCTTVAPLRRYIVRIYYISTCNVPTSGTTCTATADGGSAIPTLKMIEFADGAQTVVPLVEGIEDMQFDYGIDNAGTGVPDSYKVATNVVATSLTDTEWSNVVAVRVNLLARNTEPTTGYTDAKTYSLGMTGAVEECATTNPFTAVANTAAEVAACRAYPRHVYSELTRAENVSGRREPP